LIGGAIILVIGLLAFGLVYSKTNHHDVTITVKSKERVAEDGDGKYLVYTEDKVYEITDSLLNGNFSSSDRYNDIEEGHTYTCDAVGFRVPLFSWYENLLECSEVSPGA
jgi:hypothetical protein